MINYHKAQPCQCGHPSCNDWHVSPQAAIQGVNFTKAEAEDVAAYLNTRAKSLEKNK